MKITTRFRRLNIWNKFFVITGIATIIGLIFAFYSCLTSATGKQQQQMINDISEIKAFMKSEEERMREHLDKNYPLGYMLFGVYEKEIIIPDQSNINDMFSFNWNTVRLNSISNEYIIITLPATIDIKRKITYQGNQAIIPIKEGYKLHVLFLLSNIIKVL